MQEGDRNEMSLGGRVQRTTPRDLGRSAEGGALATSAAEPMIRTEKLLEK